jgi:O-acetylhomoserine (thiol)-lyase
VSIFINTAFVKFMQAQNKSNDFVPAMHLTTAYSYENAEHASEIFALQALAHSYTRISNPTNSELENKLSLIDNASAALVTSSGHAAQFLLMHTLLEPGDEFIASPHLYGGSINQFANTAKELGWQVVWCDVNDADQLRAAFSSKTKFVFAESLSNPKCHVLDISAVAKCAHQHGVPLVVDNTMTTPYLVSPLAYGADIVVYSLTKYIGGHGNAVGGAILEKGDFPWKENKKYQKISAARPEYAGVVFSELVDKAPFVAACRAISMRDIGACLAPFNSYLINMGLQTLHLRMQRHCDNAMLLARYLQQHPHVEKVHYAGLQDHPYHNLAKTYFRNGAGGILSFNIRGNYEDCFKCLNSLKIFTLAANFGDVQSMAIHPATTTHRQLTDQQKNKCGVSDNLIRLSVGIEDIEDLKADLDQALKSYI